MFMGDSVILIKFCYSCRRACQLYQKQEREAALLVRKQQTYALLEADEDDDDNDVGGIRNSFANPMASQSRKENNNKKCFRMKIEDQDDKDNEAYCLYSC